MANQPFPVFLTASPDRMARPIPFLFPFPFAQMVKLLQTEPDA